MPADTIIKLQNYERGLYLDVSVRDYLSVPVSNPKQIEKCIKLLLVKMPTKPKFAKACRSIVHALEKNVSYFPLNLPISTGKQTVYTWWRTSAEILFNAIEVSLLTVIVLHFFATFRKNESVIISFTSSLDT